MSYHRRAPTRNIAGAPASGIRLRLAVVGPRDAETDLAERHGRAINEQVATVDAADNWTLDADAFQCCCAVCTSQDW